MAVMSAVEYPIDLPVQGKVYTSSNGRRFLVREEGVLQVNVDWEAGEGRVV